MKQEIDPNDTSRAQAFELWMKAPNPMVTFFKTVVAAVPGASAGPLVGQER